MRRRLCLIHANCQGEPLAALLGLQPQFAARFTLKHYVNYTREPIPESELASCAIFLYQHLDAKWGEFASQALVSRLGPKCQSLCIPNLYSNYYWPFADRAPGIDYSDMFLNELIRRGLSRAEILRVYADSDPRKYYDIEALRQASWAAEEEKEKFWDIKVLGRIRLRRANLRLFNTVNHPGRELCFFVAQSLLEKLGYAPLPEAVYAAFKDPFPEFAQPLHPKIAGLSGWKFGGKDELYEVYGQPLSFWEYTGHYIDCARLGVADFISYLRLQAMRSSNSGLALDTPEAGA